MPYTIYDSGGEKKQKKGTTSITSGVVKSGCDLVMQGKVQVRLTGLGIDVWARQMTVGGGDDRGLVFYHQVGDEVVVAFNAEDPRDAIILGGLHSTKQRLPTSIPTDTTTKKIFRTGTTLTPGLSHEIEFDDAQQKITIRASLGQNVVLSPNGIKIEANANTTIELTALPKAGPGVATVTVGANKITLSPMGITIDSAGPLTITSKASIDLNAPNVSVKGIKLSLNS